MVYVEGGVAVSTNAGANFSSAFVNVAELQTFARYGAFPSANVWYLAAGQWPTAAADRADDARRTAQGLQVQRRSPRIVAVHDPRTGVAKNEIRTEPKEV